ncbi:uncharacterized protein G2W53_045060 [Senna tora]|uniref:Uncharacterized protein n=1 Tax=Senna tora TaxID=362788 RepID=A0A834VY32_9FABA|nr:uncharacterized protein G2W53_045060 [Senna tora]
MGTILSKVFGFPTAKTNILPRKTRSTSMIPPTFGTRIWCIITQHRLLAFVVSALREVHRPLVVETNLLLILLSSLNV